MINLNPYNLEKISLLYMRYYYYYYSLDNLHAIQVEKYFLGSLREAEGV